VWAELVALGSAVREESVYADVLALAHETMRRTRRNIELLIPRLQAIGYRFEHIGRDPADSPLFSPPPSGEWHNTTFVNYLRICFRQGGLPGLQIVCKDPSAYATMEKDVKSLTEGLLPVLHSAFQICLKRSRRIPMAKPPNGHAELWCVTGWY
jgi:hypothetical protein